MENENFILDIHKQSSEILGFWDERYKSELIKAVEFQYTTEVIKYWFISDLILNGDRFLIKWKKRYKPLTNEEISEQYGK